MLKRNWALIALVYMAFAEALSWAPVSDLSLCLIDPEHSQQASNHDNKKHCPAFHVGAALAFEKTDHWLERHDKSVIGAFTIVLAISTIGLWMATNKLWAAGEKQFALLVETSASQSADMKASVVAAEASAAAAMLTAKAAIGIELPIIRIEKWPGLINVPEPPTAEKPYRGGIFARKLEEFSVLSSIQFNNFGRTPAFPIKLMSGWEVATKPRSEPNYVESLISSPTAIINTGGEGFSAAARLVVRLSADEREALAKEEETFIWLFISLHYKDFLNNTHEARFCWRGYGGIFGGPTGQAPAGYSTHT